MQNRIIASIIGVLLFTSIATTSTYAQIASEQVTRAPYIVRIPPGAYQEDAEHYVPANIAIPAGTTIAWFNDDPNQPHTVTSKTGNASDGLSSFDSGVISEGAFFQHTFDKAGEFQYYCTIHPSMTGKVSVSEAVWKGHNFNVALGAGATFDFTKYERTLLHIEPTSIQIPQDEPVTYQFTIKKNGEQVFSQEFRTLGGHLYVELVPTDGATKVMGPDVSDPIIGAYHIEGSFLKDNAAYSITPEIKLLFDKPPQNRIGDEFGIQIVPEFPFGAILPVLAGIGAVVALSRSKFKFP